MCLLAPSNQGLDRQSRTKCAPMDKNEHLALNTKLVLSPPKMSLWIVASVVIALVLWVKTTMDIAKKPLWLAYPPGPPADPVIGHLRIMPSTDTAHHVFYDWSRRYGDVMYLEVPGKSILVLSSEKAASDLLDKRGALYSDRPRFAIAERLGWRRLLGFLPLGPEYRDARKALQQYFDKNNIANYRSIQEKASITLLHGLLRDPQDLDQMLHMYTSTILMDITYGHHMRSREDPIFKMLERLSPIFSACIRPSLLDISPLFEWLPSWFPGAWYQDFLKVATPVLRPIEEYPVSLVQKEIACGTARPSFVAEQLQAFSQQGELSSEDLHEVGGRAFAVTAAGTETTWHTITLFFACMVLHPAVQRRAQEEIVRVVGEERLPDFADRDALPYVECVLKEVMRWKPIGPLGVPHKLREDDTYRGMWIPKGTTVVASTTAMCLNDQKFHEPELFKPERFLPKPEGAGEVLPANVIFGWGRRICPGRYLADSAVWLAIARSLAAVTVTKAKDENGREIEPELKFAVGLTSRPLPFPCDIRPRSEKASALVKKAYDLMRVDDVTPA